ncbi:MAG: hypothetical protein N6V49_01965 [Serratia symbiotica]|nr:hypothetical protein [Serratia symbiotica]
MPKRKRRQAMHGVRTSEYKPSKSPHSGLQGIIKQYLHLMCLC